jgi:hypothetical protein
MPHFGIRVYSRHGPTSPEGARVSGGGVGKLTAAKSLVCHYALGYQLIESGDEAYCITNKLTAPTLGQ